MDCEDRWTIKNYHVGFFINNTDTENAVSASGKELCMNRRTNKVIMILLVLLLLSGCSTPWTWEGNSSGDESDSSSIQSAPAPSSDNEESSFPDGETEPKPDPLDFANEETLRALLEGEWVYCPPASDSPAA